MYNNTIFDWLHSAKNEILNISTSRVILIVATIVVLVLMTQGRKIWLHFFHVIMFAEGIQHTFFPRTVGMFVTGELDEVHILYIRTIGLLVLTWVLTYFLLSRSSDSTTDISFLLAISVMLLSSLLAMGHLWNYKPKKSKSPAVTVEPEDVSLVLYGTLLLTAGTLFHLFRSNDWGGYAEQPSHANFHLRIQFVLLLACGVVSYTIPSWVIQLQTSMDHKEIDAVHTFLVRAVGEAFLALAILTGRSANFLRNTDKDCVVVSQWMFFVVLAVWGWYGVITRWAELPWKRVAMQGIHDAVLILNATDTALRSISHTTDSHKSRQQQKPSSQNSPAAKNLSSHSSPVAKVAQPPQQLSSHSSPAAKEAQPPQQYSSQSFPAATAAQQPKYSRSQSIPAAKVPSRHSSLAAKVFQQPK